MEKNAFIFNTNKCVGCMACVVGCTIENGTEIPLNWRIVNGHNHIKHPELPVFHFSLACNHCEDAPCMKHCPALAYTRDKKTGVIIHHAEACIGCTYCTWVCPYDAPKYNETTRIVEKCNFCVDRISEGTKPACTEACPTGALDFSFQEEVDLNNHITPGFVNVGIKPSIQLIPLRKEHTKPEIVNIDAVKIDAEYLDNYVPKPTSKIHLRKEWTLVLFTLSVSGLVAWQASGITSNVFVSPIAFFIIAIFAIVLTSFHVGKKLRMWRFILNVKGSWLSREIVGFGIFFSLGIITLFIKDNIFDFNELLPFVNSNALGYITIMFGIFTLISIDMVYSLLVRKDKFKLHSAMVWLTGLLLFAWFSDFILLIFLITLFKCVLYLMRKQALFNQKITYFPLITSIRLLVLVIPLIVLIAFPEISNSSLVILVFIGEIIDRSEFYYESDVKTPNGALTDLFRNTVKTT
ncbi:4Fe-4S dicluster domain-containing protein [uncultured Lutibacter sp.]|uniref:4Fe-4S dicluster domain-containing protein n=1 Tax=uncultured Lutibacter sp. TaxID=437739 RepID=UPI00260D72E8|nr:4Fe-4S dicluster domain-containing protein [uncultured Lutibacter sp.]